MQLSPEQQQAIDTSAHVWVSASAGTGKTKILVDRIIRLLMEGVEPHHIVCLTFTKAAANEMQERLRARLSEWVSMPEDKLVKQLEQMLGGSEGYIERARQAWFALTHHPYGVAIQTIHSFCQSLLSQFPIEAGLSPGFTMMEEAESYALMMQAGEQWLHGKGQVPQEAIAQFTSQMHESSFEKWLSTMLYDQEKLRCLYASEDALEQHGTALAAWLQHEPSRNPADIIQDYYTNAPPYIDDLLVWAGNKPKERGGFTHFWKSGAGQAQRHWEAYERVFLKTDSTPRKKMLLKGEMQQHPLWEEQLEREAARFYRARQELLKAQLYANTQATHAVMADILRCYAEMKSERHVIDYTDVLLHALALLAHPEQRAWVRFKLDSRIAHVLVDEAQDTSPLQWQVITQLTEEFFAGLGQHDTRPSLFVVGDQKQSIYRFQGADPEAFHRYKAFFKQQAQQSERPFHEVVLQQSFRSVPKVLEVVDATFASPHLTQALQHGDATCITHTPFRAGQPGEVVLLPPFQSEKQTKAPVQLVTEYQHAQGAQEACCDAIAKTIARWLREGYWLESKGRHAEAGDILILLRKRGSMMQSLIQALTKHHVPVAGADKFKLTEHLAVQDVMALMEWCLDPYNDYALACVMKSPLLNMSEEQLYQLATRRGEQSLWAQMQQDMAESDALRALTHWLECGTSYDGYRWCVELLDGQYATRTSFLTRFGAEVIEPLDALLLALQMAGTSGLVQALEMLSNSTQDIKRESQQSGALRIMTTHGAKGLQAPLVWMPDMFASKSQEPLLLWHDSDDAMLAMVAGASNQRPDALTEVKKDQAQADEEEGLRLLYVAMTRAEDGLFITGVQPNRASKTAFGQWYELTSHAMQHCASEQENWQEWQGDVFVYSDVKQFDKINSLEKELNIALPEWMQQRVLHTATQAQRPSHAATEQHAGMKRGTAMHQLLQWLPLQDASQREQLAMRWLTAQLGDGKEAFVAWQSVLACLEAPELQFIWQPHAKRELPVAGYVQGRFMRGVIDCVVEHAGALWIIDYKTDRITGQHNPHLEEYAQQLAAYEQLLQPVYAGLSLRKAIIWVEDATLMHLDAEADATYIRYSRA